MRVRTLIAAFAALALASYVIAGSVAGSEKSRVKAALNGYEETPAIATAGVAAHGVHGAGTLARQAMEEHPCVGQRNGIAPATHHAPADAHRLGEERCGEAYQQHQATA